MEQKPQRPPTVDSPAEGPVVTADAPTRTRQSLQLAGGLALGGALSGRLDRRVVTGTPHEGVTQSHFAAPKHPLSTTVHP